MTKGKFGLSLSAVAVIAFTFAALRQPVAVLLVCGFALLAEKDEWLNRQVMQSLLLSIVYSLTILITDIVFGGLAQFFRWVELYKVHDAVNSINSVVGGLIYAALVVLCVLAVLRTLRGKDAGLPVLSKMAGGDFKSAFEGKGETGSPPAGHIPPQPAAPNNMPPVQTPVPEQAPPANSAVKFCSSCGAYLTGDSAFCTECGAKTE